MSNSGKSKQKKPACPGCGEYKLIEWDSVMRHWFCKVCSKVWKVKK